MYNTNNKTSKELWAITSETGAILWSRGGSSSTPRLMVYESEKKAEAALKSFWTKQVHNADAVQIRKIYSAPQNELHYI